MSTSKPVSKVMPEEQTIHDRLRHLLENLKEPEQKAVTTMLLKLLDELDKGRWQPAKR